jgi:hypothetical protein
MPCIRWLRQTCGQFGNAGCRTCMRPCASCLDSKRADKYIYPSMSLIHNSYLLSTNARILAELPMNAFRGYVAATWSNGGTSGVRRPSFVLRNAWSRCSRYFRHQRQRMIDFRCEANRYLDVDRFGFAVLHCLKYST